MKTHEQKQTLPEETPQYTDVMIFVMCAMEDLKEFAPNS